MVERETSRGVVVDLVEVIKEQLAIYSHLQELYKEVIDNIEAAKNTWANDDYIQELEGKAYRFSKDLKDIYARRQQSMNELKKLAKEYNVKMHCLLKHAIKERGIAEEVWNSDMDNVIYEQIMLDAETFMYKILSQYLWTEIVTCWRCLKDALEENNTLSSNDKDNG